MNWPAAIDFITPRQQPESAPEGECGGLGTPAGGKEPLRACGTMTCACSPRATGSRVTTRSMKTPAKARRASTIATISWRRAFAALQIAELKTADGRAVNWRAELAAKLLSLQKTDGSWVSENGLWMEKDLNLVTTYSLLALSYVHDRL